MTYFFKSGNYVKIGYSLNVQNRIKVLNQHLPVSIEVLRIAEIEEVQAHRIANMFAEHANGEWFTATPQLLNWIDSLSPMQIELDLIKSIGGRKMPKRKSKTNLNKSYA